MNFSQLETFYWAATLGSFQAAADRLNTTQPGVSTRIRQLERSLGVALFDRSGRSARLTPKGRQLVDDAQRLLTLAGSIRQRIGEQAALGGRVRLGVIDTVALTWLPRLFARLRAAFPNLEVELEVNLSFHLLDQLAHRQIDIAILAGPVTDPDFATIALCDYEQAWFAAPSLLPGSVLDPQLLAELPVLTHTRGSHQHQMILRWFRSHGAEPRRVSLCSSLATIVRLTAAGLGISVQTPSVIARELAAGDVASLPTTVAVPGIACLAVYPIAEGSPACRAVAALAAEVAREGRLAPASMPPEPRSRRPTHTPAQ